MSQFPMHFVCSAWDYKQYHKEGTQVIDEQRSLSYFQVFKGWLARLSCHVFSTHLFYKKIVYKNIKA